jgi:hypothetical protein
MKRVQVMRIRTRRWWENLEEEPAWEALHEVVGGDVFKQGAVAVFFNTVVKEGSEFPECDALSLGEEFPTFRSTVALSCSVSNNQEEGLLDPEYEVIQSVETLEITRPDTCHIAEDLTVECHRNVESLDITNVRVSYNHVFWLFRHS